MRTKSPLGFTLIELLIVVAIIAILAAIAVPNFLEAQTRAKVSRARADMRSTATALEAYAVDHNKYPLMRMVDGRYAPRPPHDQIDPATGRRAPALDRTFNHATIPLELTTPVAYITTTFKDPFKNKNTVRRSVNGTITMGEGTPTKLVYDGDQTTYDFRYDNIFQLTGINGFGFFDEDIAAYGQWRLSSCGPDNEFVGSIGRLVYDPTNGTTSLGDLIRTQASSQGERLAETSGSN